MKHMKKIILLFTAIVLMASCQEKVQEPQAPMPDPNMEKFHKNVETTKAFLEAFSNNDSLNFGKFVTDDFIWSPPSVGSDSLPRANWEEAMKGFMKAYNNKELTDAQYFAGLGEDQKPNGDVRVYGLWKSVNAETGKDSRLKWYSVLFFNDEGKITHQAEWYDTADLTKEF
jgi:ketosteroid isomerase-like protein